MAHAQHFNTVDVLRLEIEDDPTGLVNLVQNPSGELGGWGWLTPLASSSITESTVPQAIYYNRSVSGASNFSTESMPVAAGQYVAGSFYKTATGPNHYLKARFEFYDSSDVYLSSGPQTGLISATGTHQVPVMAAPASTAYVRLRFDVYTSGGANPTGANFVYLSQVTVAKSATSGELGTLRTNLIPNPSFETNVTGWSAVATSTTIARSTAQAAVGVASLAVTRTIGFGSGSLGAHCGLGTSGVPVIGGHTYSLQFRSRAATTAQLCNASIQWCNSSGGLISVVQLLGNATNSTSGWTTHSATLTAPASAAFAEVRLWIGTAATGETHYFDAVMLERAPSVGTYFDGSTTDAGGIDYGWTGTAHNSTSTATTSNLDFIEPVPYLNILGPSHELSVDRKDLDVGTLSATILDSTLDPATSDLIRPGRRVRLSALDDSTSTWGMLFTGKVLNAKVEYRLKDPNVPESKRARIALTAVDNAQALANQNRSEGVAEIADLPYVLEGCGVPWNVNGSGNQVATATVAAINENASAIDQVAVTRDSVLGYAWVDRQGTLQAWDAASLSTTVAASLDEGDYSDLSIDYDTDRCINEVRIKFLRINPGTGETEEVPYGPYQDLASIGQWGVHSAEFTVQGLTDSEVAMSAYATSILTANATPVVRINSITCPIAEASDVEYALRDLYALVELTNTAAGITDQQMRVTGIHHSISSDKWMVTYEFATTGSVASPQFIPSPPIGGGGKTIGQLLRPVGEVTMFYGAKVDIPAGWLPLDGSTVASMATDYPDLYALLGSTTLPDFTDKFPIGAGTKALGSTGGAATKSLVTDNIPQHTHSGGSLQVATSSAAGSTAARVSRGTATAAADTTPISGQSGTGTGLPGTVTPVDILNPYRALFFIIRAV